MAKREDARVIKTKARLLEVFREIIDEKPFEDITIHELCKMSDIRRATFYKHFEDKYSFLAYFVGSLRNEFDDSIRKNIRIDSTFTYYMEYIKGVVTFLDENEKMSKNILSSDVLPMLVEVIKDQNYEDTCVRLRKSIEEGLYLPCSVEVASAMMIGAVANTIILWFKNGKPIPAEQLAEEMCSIFDPIKRPKE